MRIILLSLALFLVFPNTVSAESLNAGFVQGLWYSHEPIFHNETVRIYVALRNSADDDLTATVEFFDNDEKIGSQNISAISGRLIEAWIDWTATFGEHEISASLTNIKVNGVGTNTETATVTSALARDVLLIDYDTDGDMIGNKDDTDDDGDGISDEEEIENGTDPLVPNEEEADNEESEKNEAEEEPVTVLSENNSDNSLGLERFFNEGRTHNAFSVVTDTIDTTKETLDTYREERNERIENKKAEGEKDIQTLAQPESGDPSGIATITRSKIEPEGKGIVTTLFDVLKTVFNNIYTFALFLFSLLLGYPALVELLLLLLILYAIYRTARRLGQRPQ